MEIDCLMAIRMVVSDVDGTLVTPGKQLTPATIAAARRLADMGMSLALASSRPIRGLSFLREELGIPELPIAAFNGAMIISGEGAVVQRNFVPPWAARTAIEFLERLGIAVWMFTDDQWILRDDRTPYVDKERGTIRFRPTVVQRIDEYTVKCDKIVGASSDFGLLGDCQEKLPYLLGQAVRIQRSQPYYLDVTSSDASKGTAVQVFAAMMGVDVSDVCAIGDQWNDVSMFDVAGTSIAMGNAPAGVAERATWRTESNERDGWAIAIEKFVVGAHHEQSVD